MARQARGHVFEICKPFLKSEYFVISKSMCKQLCTMNRVTLHNQISWHVSGELVAKFTQSREKVPPVLAKVG